MSENPPLFRPESFEARRMSWLGQPTVLQNISATVLAVVSIVIVIAIVAFLVFGSYTRRVSVSGVILPTEGMTRITAPGSGWLTQQFIREGDSVQRGDPLYEVSFDNTTALGDTQGVINQLMRDQREELEAEIQRREALAAQERLSLIRQRESLEQEIEQVESHIILSEEFAETLHGYAMQHREFVERGITVSQAFESRLQAYMDRRESLGHLRRQRISLGAELNRVNDRLSVFDLESASEIGEFRRRLIDVEQKIAEGESRQAIRITAPRDGVVASISTQVGQTVSTGTPLLTILPDDAELKAQLLIPSRDVGFLSEGDRVLLRYAAFPYQKFGQYPGVVSHISRAPLKQDEISLLVDGGAMAPSSTAIYRVTVQPDTPFALAYGNQVALQAGMQAEAHIMVETRPLYQWIFEPLYSLSERLSSKGVAP